MESARMDVYGGLASMGRARTSLRELVEEEVRTWYEIFYRWSRGVEPYEESEARKIYDTLAPEFRVLLTNGSMMDKSEYWGRLLSLYGVRRNDPSSHIVNLDIRPIGDEHMLVTFDLFKRGVKTKKFDSAILRSSMESPSGVAWVYVHESAHELSEVPDIP